MPLPIIAPVIGALVWTFKSRIGLFIASALAWAGLTYGTSKIVIQPTLDLIEAKLQGMGSGGDLGQAISAWMGVLQFDVAVTMIMSAYATKMAVGATKVFLAKR